ncbi:MULTISPECIES: hypothetical protein [Acetobacteraceae]|uniref:hypothetical protein n=1 Tax=Acetobacteraceae TaxID=433 RepID=UPI00183DD880|nr:MULTISPECIES: hypothetical protein [Acetobacteraceae]MBB3882710.1 hypothetical protein [Acetobacter oeni]
MSQSTTPVSSTRFTLGTSSSRRRRTVDARWTDAIHDEWIRNLLANTPDLSAERLATTKQLMNAALPKATVTGYERKHPERAAGVIRL